MELHLAVDPVGREDEAELEVTVETALQVDVENAVARRLEEGC
jgi:hypothetical protein